MYNDKKYSTVIPPSLDSVFTHSWPNNHWLKFLAFSNNHRSLEVNPYYFKLFTVSIGNTETTVCPKTNILQSKAENHCLTSTVYCVSKGCHDRIVWIKPSVHCQSLWKLSNMTDLTYIWLCTIKSKSFFLHRIMFNCMVVDLEMKKWDVNKQKKLNKNVFLPLSTKGDIFWSIQWNSLVFNVVLDQITHIFSVFTRETKWWQGKW